MLRLRTGEASDGPSASRDPLPPAGVPTLDTGQGPGSTPIMSASRSTPRLLETLATHQDHQDWLRMWRKGQTDDFHQAKINPLLRRFWHTLVPDPAARVFVPLCGKSLDLLWLAARGHEVIGVELSPVAINAFFSECGLKPDKRKRGKLTRHDSERISLLCGDFFRLEPDDLGAIDVVYDRAALTALPEALRAPYVARLRHLVPPQCTVFLVTVADVDPDAPDEVRAGGIDEDIRRLYAAHFDIDMAHREPGFTDLEHTAYRLRPRPR
ncbi:thiopurine S-methyltransferase [Nitrogeniibacter aestuarii]|uniref:thiopurine S-methyltransferase n=1 Tax=Nitrogeniibacter aestuarii TaxID=2815343 RepID=UPI001D106EFC|nr:thiopurine S-methyltransferase [Nitrogeniibacter aestuarii]